MKRRADGRWVKKKTINGESVFFYSSAETEKQAIKDIENQMIEHKAKKHIETHNFKSLADKMLDLQSLSVSYNTMQSYTHSLKYLKPFYEYDITNITPTMVQKLIDDMVKKKGYSFSAVSKAKVVFGLVLDYAIVHENLNINNFTRSIKIPKNAPKGKVTSPPDEVRSIIIDNAEAIEFGMWAMIFLCTGLRRGEQAALRKKDIDFDNDIILVKDAVEFIVNQPNLKGRPKTEASIDSVPILSILKPSLMRLCDDLQPNDFIFGGNKPLTKTQIDKRWKKYCQTIGHEFNGHQLRHAYAKMIYEAGVDVKTAQRLLRHADIRTTMNIYTEFSQKMTDESVDKINNYLKTL